MRKVLNLFDSDLGGHPGLGGGPLRPELKGGTLSLRVVGVASDHKLVLIEVEGSRLSYRMPQPVPCLCAFLVAQLRQ